MKNKPDSIWIDQSIRELYRLQAQAKDLADRVRFDDTLEEELYELEEAVAIQQQEVDRLEQADFGSDLEADYLYDCYRDKEFEEYKLVG